jgi:pilus assembly protein Flp/PilA
LTAFIGDSSGATSIEYAMIAAGISVAIIAALSTLSVNVKALFDSIVAAL